MKSYCGYRGYMLTNEVKLTDFGAASPTVGLSKEDERSAALAARAQNGDYDDGMDVTLYSESVVSDLNFCRLDPRTISTKSGLFER
jgi:hypothetical protein